MKKQKTNKTFIIIAVVLIVLLIILLTYAIIKINEKQAREKPIADFIPDSNNTLTIMNWNIQVFGKTKWNNTGIREEILSIVPRADIIFIQEIRDKSGEVFQELCNQLNQSYNCNISSRAGRSSSKEQYGIIYKKEISIVSFHDYNPDQLDRWERPPIEITFNISNYIFKAVNIHTKPEDTLNELKHLETIYLSSSWQGNWLWLGDFNADCSYYNPASKSAFINNYWVIKDSDDTTVSKTNCAYDRIIMNDDMKKEYLKYGIYTNIKQNTSDHYPVWIEINATEKN